MVKASARAARDGSRPGPPAVDLTATIAQGSARRALASTRRAETREGAHMIRRGSCIATSGLRAKEEEFGVSDASPGVGCVCGGTSKQEGPNTTSAQDPRRAASK